MNNLIRLKEKNRYDTDKDNDYLCNYDLIFRPLRKKRIKLLELGIYTGGSLLMWRDYFSRGIIADLDIEPVEIADSTERVKIYQGMQQDCILLDKIRQEIAPDGFDIIIDDASHIAKFTSISFWHLFLSHL